MIILYVIGFVGMFGTSHCGASQRNTLFAKALAQLGHVDVCSFSEEEIVSDIDGCDVVYSNPIPEEGNKYVRQALLLTSMLFHPANPYSYFRKNTKKEKIVDGICI